MVVSRLGKDTNEMWRDLESRFVIRTPGKAAIMVVVGSHFSLQPKTSLKLILEIPEEAW